MKRKNIERLYILIEHCYPALCGIAGCLVLFIIFDYAIISDLSNLLNSIINFTTLVIGFLGVLLALLFSLNENIFIKFIFEDEYYRKKLKIFFKAPIISGFALVLCSISMLFKISVKWNTLSIINYLFTNIKYIEVFLLIYFILSSYRIMNFVLKYVFSSTKHIEEEKLPNEGYSKEDIKVLQEKYAINHKKDK